MLKSSVPTGGHSQHNLEARLLGGLTLRYNGQPLSESAFRRRKSFILLLQLLTSPGKSLPVDSVLELLWPEQDPQVAAANLRTVLSGIRAALPDRTAQNPVVRLDAALALDPLLDLALDIDQFEAAAAAGLSGGDPALLRRSLGLYLGPLLPNLPYEEWVLERRAALARLHRQVLLALTAQGETVPEKQLRALLAEDPADEQVGQALIRLLGAAGRRAEALRVAHTLVTALREELGVSPGPETLALHAALLEPTPVESNPATAPAALVVRRHNLPAAISSFVGRVWERAELRQLLDRTRLLTLTGAGGCGKTRLAVTLAEEQSSAFPDGVRLVELAPVGTGAEVTRATAHALGLQEEPDRPLLDTLVAYLKDRTTLILLDNCEHVLEACAESAYALLRACPGLRVLATSRERLGIIGETVWPVPPLTLPDGDVGSSLAQLAQAEAVQLFVERVRSVQTGFALNTEHAQAVEHICRQLDGLPLALELAAAHSAMLTMEEIAERLDDRFRLLTVGNRGALPRHQTLRAALDWSWDLLEEDEQTMLGRLAVFVGGWALQAADVVCAEEGQQDSSTAEVRVLGILDGLVAKSLVQAHEAESGEVRYRLLETVRQYAWERLEATGTSPAVRERHLDWCIELAQAAQQAPFGPEQQVWETQLEAEHDNIRAALTWGVREGRSPTSGLRLAAPLWRFWLTHGYVTEGRRWLESALAAADIAPSDIRASALVGAGNLAHRNGDFSRAGSHYGQGLALFRALEDRSGIGMALNGVGLVAWSLGDYGQANAAFEEGLSLGREMDHTHYVAIALLNLANVAKFQGEYQRARTLYEEALALLRDLGDRFNMATTLGNLGNVVPHQGDFERAIELHRESLALYREMGDTTGIAMALCNLGMAVAEVDDAAEAMAFLEESRDLFRELDNPQGLTGVMGDLGKLAQYRGDYEQAERLHTESLILARRVGNKQSIAVALDNLGWAVLRRGNDTWALSLLREGLHLARDIGDRGLTAAGLEIMADILSVQGGALQAATLFGAAEHLRESLHAALSRFDLMAHDQTVGAVRTTLGEEGFSVACSAGHVLSIEQAVDLALAWGQEAAADPHACAYPAYVAE